MEDVYQNFTTYNVKQDLTILGIYININDLKKKIYEIYLTSDSYFSSYKLRDSKFIIKEVDIDVYSDLSLLDKKYKNLINGKMSHEIKTPCISMSYYLLDIKKWLMSTLDQSDHHKFLSVITKLKALTDQILNVNWIICDYTRSIGECEIDSSEIILNELIDWGYWYLKAVLGTDSKEIEVEIEYNGISYKQELLDHKNLLDDIPEEIEIYSDPIKLRLILSELLKNSLKYTTKGKISLSVEEKHDYVLIQVKDTGKGMDPNRLNSLNSLLINLEKKFQDVNFIQTKISELVTPANFAESGGFDIGLQLIKIYCFKLDIKFSIESESGNGFTAKLMIPNGSDLRNSSRIISNTSQLKPNFKYSKVFSPSTIHSPQTEDINKALSYAKFKDLIKMSESKFLNRNKPPKSYNKLAVINELDLEEFNTNDSPERTMGIINSRNSPYPRESKNDQILLLSKQSDPQNNPISKASNRSTNNLKLLSRNFTKDSSSFSKDMQYILVVDDDYMCRKNAKRMAKDILADFMNLNLGVIKASDGLDTLNFIIKDQLKHSHIKMIIRDENMNYLNGSDSYKILDRLASLKKLSKIPMIILTAFEDSDILFRLKESGCIDEIMRKPMNKSSLKKIIRRYLFNNIE